MFRCQINSSSQMHIELTVNSLITYGLPTKYKSISFEVNSLFYDWHFAVLVCRFYICASWKCLFIYVLLEWVWTYENDRMFVSRFVDSSSTSSLFFCITLIKILRCSVHVHMHFIRLILKMLFTWCVHVCLCLWLE